MKTLRWVVLALSVLAAGCAWAVPGYNIVITCPQGGPLPAYPTVGLPSGKFDSGGGQQIVCRDGNANPTGVPVVTRVQRPSGFPGSFQIQFIIVCPDDLDVHQIQATGSTPTQLFTCSDGTGPQVPALNDGEPIAYPPLPGAPGADIAPYTAQALNGFAENVATPITATVLIVVAACLAALAAALFRKATR